MRLDGSGAHAVKLAGGPGVSRNHRFRDTHPVFSPDGSSYLETQLALVPTDRIAQCSLVHEAIEPGARTLGAYDEFIRLMNDEEFRRELSELPAATQLHLRM